MVNSVFCLLALASFNFKKGSEVITPNLTFSTTVSPIYQTGLIPHFIGVKINSLQMSIKLKNVLTKTVAIMIPNLLGIYVIGKEYIKLQKIQT